MTNSCSFPYSKFAQSLESSVSSGRLEIYTQLAGSKRDDALRLYCWNTALSQSLYWPLQAFEITFRNAVADRLADEHGDDWYEKIASFSSSRRTSLSDEERRVLKAKQKLDSDGIVYGHDAIVAAISFGFWTGLLKSEYKSKLWDPQLSQIFPMINLNEAFKKTHLVKDLRNSVAHYEPIIAHLPNGTVRELFRDYKLVLKLIRWICPDTAHWVEQHSAAQFFDTWNSCPQLSAHSPRIITISGTPSEPGSWHW